MTNAIGSLCKLTALWVMCEGPVKDRLVLAVGGISGNVSDVRDVATVVVSMPDGFSRSDIPILVTSLVVLNTNVHCSSRGKSMGYSALDKTGRSLCKRVILVRI